MNEETADACPICGSRHLMVCYGLALGGLGAYLVCEDCDEVIWKERKDEGQCLHGLPSEGGP